MNIVLHIEHMNHNDGESYSECPMCIAEERQDALDAGIPASVIDGKTKLSEHFTSEQINANAEKSVEYNCTNCEDTGTEPATGDGCQDCCEHDDKDDHCCLICGAEIDWSDFYNEDYGLDR